MGKRQAIGCTRDEVTILQKEGKEVEKSTIIRRMQIAPNPIRKRSIQKIHEKLEIRVSKDPIIKKPNHKRIENIERAAQRLEL